LLIDPLPDFYNHQLHVNADQSNIGQVDASPFNQPIRPGVIQAKVVHGRAMVVQV
jgi:hypothetical protein